MATSRDPARTVVRFRSPTLRGPRSSTSSSPASVSLPPRRRHNPPPTVVADGAEPQPVADTGDEETVADDELEAEGGMRLPGRGRHRRRDAGGGAALARRASRGAVRRARPRAEAGLACRAERADEPTARGPPRHGAVDAVLACR